MDQPDHMIDMGILLSVNFCPCKIRYQNKMLRDQRKASKGGVSTLRFLKLKKISFSKYIFL